MKSLSSFVLTFGFLVINYLFALAQDPIGIIDSFHSEILQEERIIQILLPEDIDKEKKYDVIYILDGDGNIEMISDIQSYAQKWNYMPSTILVAIHNVDRNRDFLPSKMDNLPTSGGADKFIACLEKELIPFVEGKYPVNGNNILYGHSFGGVLAMYALLTAPHLFDDYIAADPSFWYDDGFMIRLASEKLQMLTAAKSFFYSGREGNGYNGMRLDKMDSLLKVEAPDLLSWKSFAYPNENHGSVRFKTIYDGLKFIYDGYNSSQIDFHPMAGIIPPGQKWRGFLLSDHNEVRYTTDGTTPDKSSPEMKMMNEFIGPVEVMIRTFTKRGRFDTTQVISFEKGEIWAALIEPGNIQPGGFNYHYYEGEWDSLPDFRNLEMIQSGTVDSNFQLNQFPRKENFGVVIEGFLEIDTAGLYIFILGSDDGSKLYLADQSIIDYDGLHGNDRERTYILPLEKGFYPLRLEYFQREQGADLFLGYLPPGINEPIPIPLQYQHSTIE